MKKTKKTKKTKKKLYKEETKKKEIYNSVCPQTNS